MPIKHSYIKCLSTACALTLGALIKEGTTGCVAYLALGSLKLGCFDDFCDSRPISSYQIRLKALFEN